MITNHKLLIDKHCPMCKAYGYCFTKLGIISEDTVRPYQDIETDFSKDIDMERARNEIALLDTESRKSVYGLNAMIKIVSHNSELLRLILNFGPIHFVLNLIYKFISYNRKIVIPIDSTVGCGKSCAPDFHLGYRWAYLIFTAIFTGVVLSNYFTTIFSHFKLTQLWYTEFIICFAQIVWQGLLARILAKGKVMDYLGNMSSVSNMGAFLLLPMLLLSNFFASWSILLIYFAIVVGLMFFEHIIRCKLLGISKWMTVSWLSFRIAVLIVLLLLNL